MKPKRGQARYNEFELAERRAASTIGRQNASRKPKKTREELMAFVFGNSEVTPVRLLKSAVELTEDNRIKYDLISQHICSVIMNDGTMYHGRVSKMENNEKSLGKKITDKSTVHFWNFKTQEYVTIELTEVVNVRSNGEDVNFK
jgi:hypothetical protein